MKRALYRLRALLRIELREMQRHVRRTTLLALLIAIPVAAVVGGSILGRTTEQTLEERRRQTMGDADLMVELPSSYEELVAAHQILSEATTTALSLWGVGSVRTRAEEGRAQRQLQVEEIAIAPLAESASLGASFFDLVSGELPVNAGEVALSSGLLDSLGVEVGDDVLLDYGGWRRIAGEVVNPESLDRPFLLRTAAAVEHRGEGFTLAKLPKSARETTAEALRAAGHEVLLREEVQASTDEAAWVVAILGSVGFFEASLIMAAAFLVGLQRRQVEVGLVAAAGATPNAIGLSLLVSSALLAFASGVLGSAFGLLGALAVHPFLDPLNGRINGPLEIHWLAAVAGLLVGVLTALLASVVPAVRASRRPIKESLSGRRPRGDRGFLFGVVGAVCIVVSLGLLLFAPRTSAVLGAAAIICGSILGMLGFGIASPTFLALLARSASRLPLAWRLAVRDAGRFRGRNGPVVTAILAGMSMSVTVALLTASIDRKIDELPQTYRTDQLLVAGPAAESVSREIEGALQASAAAPLQAAYLGAEPIRVRQAGSDPETRGQWIAIGDDEALRALGVDRRPEGSEGHLLQLGAPDAGLLGLLGRDESTQIDDAVELSTWRVGMPLAALPVTTVSMGETVRDPLFFVDRATAETRGWTAGPPLDRTVTPWLIRLPQAVADKEIEAARQLAAAAAGTEIDAQLLKRRPTQGFYQLTLGLCMLTGLIVLLVATSLSAAESRRDEELLEVLGAAPATQRQHRAARAAYLATLGCTLAVPAGFFPVIGLFESSNLPLEWVIPWRALALAALGLPLFVYFLTWAYDRIRKPQSAPRGFGWTGTKSAGVAVLLLFVSSTAESRERWQVFEGEAFNGGVLRGEVTEVRVPVRHADPDGPTLALRVVRYRTSHPNPGPPILYLAGGPGGPGAELVGRFATHPQLRLLETADVIAVDQRGVGGSEPRLDGGPPPRLLPLDRSVSRDEAVRSLASVAEGVWSYWKDRGVDLATLNTHEAALDLELVRRELGLGKVTLYGASYGSHLGLAYLRLAPEGVERAVLVRVEGPDDTWKLPDVTQARLERLSEDCRASSVCRELTPDLLETLRALLQRLRTDEISVAFDADLAERFGRSPGRVRLGPFELQLFVALRLGESPAAADLPLALARFTDGDWSQLAEMALEVRTPSLDPMPWATDCASSSSEARWQRIERQRTKPENLLGDALLAPHFPEACRPCRGCRLPGAFRKPLQSSVSTLLVSGEVDPRTPPENADDVAAGLRDAVQVLVLSAGHESRELGSPEYRRLLQSFLIGEPVGDLTVTLPTLPFSRKGDSSP